MDRYFLGLDQVVEGPEYVLLMSAVEMSRFRLIDRVLPEIPLLVQAIDIALSVVLALLLDVLVGGAFAAIVSVLHRAELQVLELVFDGFRSHLSTFGSEFGIVQVLSHHLNLFSGLRVEGLG